jgi:hypothetical protein
MLQHILDIATPIALSAITALLGFIAAKLRRLPATLLVFAEAFLAHAHVTPGIGDDVAGTALVLFAKALQATLGERAGDAGALGPPPAPAPPQAATTRIPPQANPFAPAPKRGPLP